MRYLVTGAAGFVGSHLVKSLVAQGHKVNCLDGLLESTYGREIKERQWQILSALDGTSMHQLDLRYDDVTEALDGVNIVVHAAAMPGLMLSWDKFEMYSSCNVLGTQRLIDTILKTDKKICLTHISTSSVYGNIATGDETSILRPASPYGVTKLAAEKLIEAYSANFGLRYTTLRYFSIFGPGQRPDMAYSKFINAIAKKLPITVYGTGLQTRTNTFITDCVNATIEISKRDPIHEIYNFSGNEKINVLEVIAILEDLIGEKAIVEFGPPRPGDQFATEGKFEKLENEISYSPKIGIREGLALQYQDFLHAN